MNKIIMTIILLLVSNKVLAQGSLADGILYSTQTRISANAVEVVFGDTRNCALFLCNDTTKAEIKEKLKNKAINVCQLNQGVPKNIVFTASRMESDATYMKYNLNLLCLGHNYAPELDDGERFKYKALYVVASPKEKNRVGMFSKYTIAAPENSLRAISVGQEVVNRISERMQKAIISHCQQHQGTMVVSAKPRTSIYGTGLSRRLSLTTDGYCYGFKGK